MPTNHTEQVLARLADLTPRQIVAELDRYIVGQGEAKKAVAIALRNRWRRQRTPEAIREEIAPNNIILIGPTGVGKTEIARRLAKLAGAPFIKVEASSSPRSATSGRDVESMVRDLVESAIDMVRTEREAEIEDLAQRARRRAAARPPPPAARAAQDESRRGAARGGEQRLRRFVQGRRHAASRGTRQGAPPAHAREAPPAAQGRPARSSARWRSRSRTPAPR